MTNRKFTTVVLRKGGVGSRDNCPFLTHNYKVWQALKRGEEVDFPVDELALAGDLLIDLNASRNQPTRKPKKVVKDDKGNIWHDGVLFSGPDLDSQRQTQGAARQELSSEERLKQVMTEAKEKETTSEEEELEEEELEEEEEEGSPSSEEADDSKTKRRLKRRRKKL
jgi:hypothetical protein